MNAWGENFPEDLTTLINKCENIYKQIEMDLQREDCLLVADFYEEKEGKTRKNTATIEKLKHQFNSKPSKDETNYNDIKGLYVFASKTINNINPEYIGISRNIIARLKQHGWGKYDNEATLAFLRARIEEPQKIPRKDFSLDKIKLHQEAIRNHLVVIVPVEEDYDLYFMEVYLSGKFKTKWNSFRTH